jgi:beta-glucosidase
LAQAATWDPEVVEQAARQAANEAAAEGIRWTFAPMMDIAHDPRWGRIAESLGEDPRLSSAMAAAMVRGFQGASLDDGSSVAACAKHFAGYGAAEAGARLQQRVDP